jgi:hypothetical protein
MNLIKNLKEDSAKMAGEPKTESMDNKQATPQ